MGDFSCKCLRFVFEFLLSLHFQNICANEIGMEGYLVITNTRINEFSLFAFESNVVFFCHQPLMFIL